MFHLLALPSVFLSTYREDPAVMVVRMEALLMLDHVTTFTKYYKIADRVLRVLTGILLKVSPSLLGFHHYFIDFAFCRNQF